MTKIALTITGSDSGGGAGVQADIRTFAFHKVHGTCAITCLTAQNTLGVERVEFVSPDMLRAQIDAVLKDIGCQAVKTGSLFARSLMEVVVEMADRFSPAPLVVDPVMVSRAGSKLVQEEAIVYLREKLIPLATIVTPNLHEARILSGMEIGNIEDMKKAAARIHERGARVVLIKGGAMAGELKGVDIWFDGRDWETFRTKIVPTSNTHGTGCTLSAAITADLALGLDLKTAVGKAKEYVTNALDRNLSIGRGTGTVGHFYPLLTIDS